MGVGAVAEARLVADLVAVAVTVPAVPAATVVELVVTAPVAVADIREAAVLAEVEAAAAGVAAQVVGEDLAKSIPSCRCVQHSVHTHHDHCHVIRLFG